MTRRRFLPEYVTSFKDRHGKERLRFRRKGYPSHYFTAPFGTEAFRTEYRACMDAPPAGGVLAAIERTAPGTIDDLVARYFSVPSRLGPTLETQKKVRAVIDRFRQGRGHRQVAQIEFQHIEAIVAKRRQKVLVGTRMEGGVEAARKLLKELVRLFDFAVKIRMIRTNPAKLADKVKVAPAERSKGFHTWTEEEIGQYRKHHKLGTRARLAMELMLWTDQRRIDMIRMGRQHIRDGRIKVTQSKTGKELWIAVAPQLLEAIIAMPPRYARQLCFLTTEWGKPFSNPGFGNWFRDQCDAAGLPQCTAHGLRKATMRRMAELDMSNQTMKALSGHTKDDEVALYTAAASQIRMADDAIARLSAWEKTSNPTSEVSHAPAVND